LFCSETASRVALRAREATSSLPGQKSWLLLPMIKSEHAPISCRKPLANRRAARMSFGIKRSASFYGAIPQTTQTKNRVPFWSRPPGRVFPFGKLKRTAFCIASRRFNAARGEHHQGRFKAAFAAVVHRKIGPRKALSGVELDQLPTNQPVGPAISKNSHESIFRLRLPAGTRLLLPGGGQGVHQRRHRRRRCRPHGWARQARRSGGLCGRSSRSQQAQPQQLERAGPVGTEVADRMTH
jgi:hypothetical protein